MENNDKIIVVINRITYQAIKNTSSNWNKCDLCDFCQKGKCCANENLIRICNALEDVYWQDVYITIKNKLNNNDDYTIVTDMINMLKREGIYNESF